MSAKVHDLTQIDALADADEFYTVDVSGVGSARNRKSLQSQQIAFFPMKGLLNGLTLANNVGDATNDIDFAAGKCTDSTGVAVITCAALTKQLDAVWAVGSAAGGLDTGSIANATYHCFAIKKDSDGSGDFLFSTSPTAPTMPAGYTYFRRIGSIIRGSGAIIPFVQVGDTFMRSVPLNNTNQLDPTAAVSARVAVTCSVPTGIIVEAIVTAALLDAGAGAATYMLLTSPDQADTAASNVLHDISIGAAGAAVPQECAARIRIRTDSSRQIYYRVNQSQADLRAKVTTHGWVDTRDRLV